MAYDGSRAQYYREKALRVREIANSFLDAAIKDEYEQLAKVYEQLADRVEAGKTTN